MSRRNWRKLTQDKDFTSFPVVRPMSALVQLKEERQDVQNRLNEFVPFDKMVFEDDEIRFTVRYMDPKQPSPAFAAPVEPFLSHAAQRGLTASLLAADKKEKKRKGPTPEPRSVAARWFNLAPVTPWDWSEKNTRHYG